MKDFRLYLHHMLECSEKIESYVGRGEKIFLADSMAQDAVARNFEIIGEAAKRIPVHVQTKAPGIPWRRVAGLRDMLIHQYEGVNWSQVWKIATEDLPALQREIRKLLK
jgi:uncharacterized protein with HEPN domain